MRPTVFYLYGLKHNAPRRLVATFGSEQQLLAYVRWATLGGSGGKGSKFEQGSALAGYSGWEYSEELLTDDDEESGVHNPTPSML
jgi:hypothetical protein